jgi:opacity protein-like surface antigen
MTSGDARMKISIAAALMSLTVAATAAAQPSASAASTPSKGYAEVVAQSAFGNVTSQSFGGEIGVTVYPDVQVFVDAGYVRDAAPASLGANAQKIAAGVAAIAGPTDFHVKEPVAFGVAGLKYVVPTGNSRIEPYVLGGAGLAQVKKDVTFSTASGDISQFATIGSDLSGDETKAMISVGGGVGVPVSSRVVIDLQYRYGRVFTSDGGLNINRAGIGVGVRF